MNPSLMHQARPAAGPAPAQAATMLGAADTPSPAAAGVVGTTVPAAGAPARAATTATTQQPAMPAAASAPASGGSLGGAVLALLLVVALILGLAWLARRLPGIGAVRANPALRLVGSLALGPRERVVVVAVGDTQLLLGVGAGGTRTLHALDAPLPEAVATTPAFAQVLARQFGRTK